MSRIGAHITGESVLSPTPEAAHVKATEAEVKTASGSSETSSPTGKSRRRLVAQDDDDDDSEDAPSIVLKSAGTMIAVVA